MKAFDIMNIMNEWAPSYLVDSWDHTGFQIGDGEKEVERILVSLDLDLNTYEKAVKENVDMIITHHPILFNPIYEITTDNYKGKLICDLIKKDIVVYNAHTNLDVAIGGINDILAELLGLEDMEVLETSYEGMDGILYGYGRVGNIKEMGLYEFLDIVKEKLDADNLLVYGETDKNIERVALCGGSGGDFIYAAYKSGADLYLTSDIKYHEAQLANELGIVLIDGNHFNTEKVILPIIKEKILKETNKNVEVFIHEKSTAPFKIY